MRTIPCAILGICLLFASVKSGSGQEIFDAVKTNDLDAVRSLVRADPGTVRQTDDTGHTPLHCAAVHNRADIARFLLKNGADVNAAAHRSKTPLHYAATNDFTPVVEVLLMHDASLELRDNYGRTALLLCARERGGPGTAKLLIEAGADINAKDRFESIPLELAAWRGKSAFVNLLIEYGAEVPVTGRQANLMLMMACQHGLTNLFNKQVERGIEVTIPNAAGGTLLHDAAKGGSVQIVNTLTAKGLSVDLQDKYGWAPIHYAAMFDRPGVIRKLIELGADPGVRTTMGQSAYNIAGEYGLASIQDLLRSQGCDTRPIQFPLLEGEYVGQKPPQHTPEIFAPGIISSIWGLHSSLAFAPDGNSVYWSPMVERPGAIYSKGIIYYMERIHNCWTPPRIASFSNLPESDDGEPFFSPDGDRLYFNSSRPNPLQTEGGKENIWFVEKRGNGWTEPRPVDQVINRMQMHWQFSVDKRGNLYFSSDDPGGSGMADIYCAEFKNGTYQTPVNLGKSINTEEGDHTPFISPAGDYLIYSSRYLLHISYRRKDGSWSEPRKLDYPINTEFELCPIITPDQKYLIFLSHREGESHPFWVKADFIEELRMNGVE